MDLGSGKFGNDYKRKRRWVEKGGEGGSYREGGRKEVEEDGSRGKKRGEREHLYKKPNVSRYNSGSSSRRDRRVKEREGKVKEKASSSLAGTAASTANSGDKDEMIRELEAKLQAVTAENEELKQSSGSMTAEMFQYELKMSSLKARLDSSNRKNKQLLTSFEHVSDNVRSIEQLMSWLTKRNGSIIKTDVDRDSMNSPVSDSGSSSHGSGLQDQSHIIEHSIPTGNSESFLKYQEIFKQLTQRLALIQFEKQNLEQNFSNYKQVQSQNTTTANDEQKETNYKLSKQLVEKNNQCQKLKDQLAIRTNNLKGALQRSNDVSTQLWKSLQDSQSKLLYTENEHKKIKILNSDLVVLLTIKKEQIKRLVNFSNHCLKFATGSDRTELERAFFQLCKVVENEVNIYINNIMKKTALNPNNLGQFSLQDQRPPVQSAGIIMTSDNSKNEQAKNIRKSVAKTDKISAKNKTAAKASNDNITFDSNHHGTENIGNSNIGNKQFSDNNKSVKINNNIQISSAKISDSNANVVKDTNTNSKSGTDNKTSCAVSNNNTNKNYYDSYNSNCNINALVRSNGNKRIPGVFTNTSVHIDVEPNIENQSSNYNRYGNGNHPFSNNNTYISSIAPKRANNQPISLPATVNSMNRFLPTKSFGNDRILSITTINRDENVKNHQDQEILKHDGLNRDKFILDAFRKDRNSREPYVIPPQFQPMANRNILNQHYEGTFNEHNSAARGQENAFRVPKFHTTNPNPEFNPPSN